MKKYFCTLLAVILIFSGIMLSACQENYVTYDISTYINGARFGDVWGDGTYQEGKSITIHATPKATASSSTKNEFLCWIHQNQVVSLNADYTFTVNKSTAGTYIALFKSPNLEYVMIDNVEMDEISFNEDTYGLVKMSEISLELGTDFNHLTNVYSMSLEDNNLKNNITQEELLTEYQLPYTFDKTRAIYAKIKITFIRENDFIYTSTTNLTISDIQLTKDLETNKLFEKISFDVEKPILNGTTRTLEFVEAPQISVTFASLSDYLLKDVVEE